MPDVVFVLPHWLYWLGLVAFPLVAMGLARHYRPRTERGYSLVTSYFIWIVSGFLGLHRLYLRNLWGLLFWPLFGFILYASAMESNVRIKVSDARAGIELAEKSSLRSQRRIERSTSVIVETRAQLAEAESDSNDASRIELLQRRIDREQERVDEAQARVSAIKSEREALEAELVDAESSREFWANFARTMFYGVLAFLAIDGFAMPWLKRRAETRRSARQAAPQATEQQDTASEHTEPDSKNNYQENDRPENERQQLGGARSLRVLDRISLFTGEYVAFWSVLAVFVYYYEVVVRYVFNSPTNWAHEGMFLMFGMQYLIAGSYAMLTESHVRVDIFYARFSRRGKAITDLLTSVFFFIFAGTLLATGFIFASDAMQGSDWSKWEVSFTEWAIHYWPVKIALVLGALLLIVQGLSHLYRDLLLVFGSMRTKEAR